MPRAKGVKVIREKERGLVPSRRNGIEDEVYGNFLAELDPENREEIQIALASAKDQRFREFLGLIGRKVGNRTVSLAANAKACGIRLSEFNEWTNSSATQQALAVAMRAAPRVAQKLAQDAVEIVEFCGRCDGTGEVTAQGGLHPEPEGYRLAGLDFEGEELWVRTCPHGADGKIRRAPSEHAQDKILEMAKLINQKGPGMTLVQHFGGAGHQSAVSALDAMTIDVEAERG